jgi:hypothetical protein
MLVYLSTCMHACATRYMVGDKHQRIYGWRGARKTFETLAVDHEFFLTFSFRFGPKIAEIAQLVMRHGDARAKIHGLAKSPGEVRPAYMFESGAVLTRTNKGMVDTLFQLTCDGGVQRTWAFASKGSSK